MINPSEGSTYRIGDIIAVELFSNSGCSHPNFALLKITGIPDKAPEEILLKRIKRMLLNHVDDKAILSEIKILRRRRWRIKVTDLPDTVKIALRDNKEFTATWSQVKPYLERRVIDLSDQENEANDTFIVAEDGDL